MKMYIFVWPGVAHDVALAARRTGVTIKDDERPIYYGIDFFTFLFRNIIGNKSELSDSFNDKYSAQK